MSAGGAEADGPEDGGNGGDQVLPEIVPLSHLAHLLKGIDHPEAQDVGLPFFQG